MSESMEYEFLTAHMGDVVFDDGIGESLYHYQEEQEQPRERRRPATRARAPQYRDEEDMADDTTDPSATATPSPAPAPPSAPVQNPTPDAPRRGLKTPLILGVSAGLLAAAGVYGYCRWKRPDEESPVTLAGVAGGTSAVGVILTVLAARGAGLLGKKA